jgi:hypothetical protein
VILQQHPSSLPTDIDRVEVAARRSGQLLDLQYHCAAREGAIALPPTSAPGRADGLWRATCCEAFLRTPGSEAYLEFNFSPSGQWAAYAFDAYRSGMREIGITAPRLVLDTNAGGFELRVEVEVPKEWSGDWNCALTAVLLDHVGRPSHWSLRQSPGQPDFHHASNFVLALPAASPASR